MEFETYEIILILIAVVATIALIYWALNRGTQEGQPGAQAPKENDRAIRSAEAGRDAATPAGGEESTASAPGVPRARDAAKSRSGSARRTAKPGASSGRAAAPAAAPASAFSDEPSSKIQEDAAPAPEPSPVPAPEPAPVSDAKPAEPSKEASAPAEKPSSPRRDDLTVIRGIGKSIEKKLNALGITTFEQMAAWTREDLDRVDAALAFPGRAQRENWVGQAKTLAQKK